MSAFHARRTVLTGSLLLVPAFAALPASATDRHATRPAQCVPAAPGSLPDQVAKLAARVAKLEGKIKAADLVGKYAVTTVGLSLTGFTSGTPPRPAAISHSAGRAFLTLNADGTSRFEPNNDPVPCGASALTQGLWTVAPTPCEDDGAETGLWSYADGILKLSSEDGSEVLPLDVGVGGRLLTIAWSGFYAGDQQSETVLIIASRLK